MCFLSADRRVFGQVMNDDRSRYRFFSGLSWSLNRNRVKEEVELNILSGFSRRLS